MKSGCGPIFGCLSSIGSACQSTTGTEEAKDFKVVVTLDNPSDDLRPGLSATAKILTARKDNVLSIPIQALTMRRPSETVNTGKGNVVDAASATKEPQVQGVFVLRHDGRKLKAVFVPVNTGVTGTTDSKTTPPPVGKPTCEPEPIRRPGLHKPRVRVATR